MVSTAPGRAMPIFAAVLATLMVGSVGAQEARSSVTTEVKGEFAAYTDTDSVSVVSPSTGVKLHDASSGWQASGSYLIDVVSAASVDIVSTASGRWNEVRHAASLQAGYKPYDLGGTVSGSVSREPDYLSLTGGGGVSWDFVRKTVMPSATYSFTHDIAGRAGTPFEVYSLELDRHSLGARLQLVINRESLLDVGVDAGFEVGHQEKPYRYVPLFAPDIVSAIGAGMPVDAVNAARLPGRTEERLPTTRQRYAFSARFAQRLADSTFLIDQRLYADSWGVKASTTNLRVVFDLSRRVNIWPELRFHAQSGASFWRLAYAGSLASDGTLTVPALRTGDRELSPLTSGSGGAGLHLNLGSAADPTELGFTLLAQSIATRYTDALFITQRFGFFSAVQAEAKF